jgi:hypothetical protein
MRHGVGFGPTGPRLERLPSRRGRCDASDVIRTSLSALGALVILASGCSSDRLPVPGQTDYFTQLKRISENAQIQERGLDRDLRKRLERSTPGQERLDVVVIFVQQSAALYEDVVSALRNLQPVDGLRGPHVAYMTAWEDRLGLMRKIRDAGFRGAMEYLRALDAPAFDRARRATRERCEELRSAASAAGRPVELACDNRVR